MRRVTGLKQLLGVDLRALALFRVALGLLLGADTLLRLRDLRAHYTDLGVLPAGAYWSLLANEFHISLHLANGTVGWQALLFALTLAAAAAVTVGYRTRAATVCAWVLLVSVQNRNPLLLNGGDVLLRLLYFWAMFLPLGARRSVDAALSQPRQCSGPAFFSGATVALVAQIAIVYLVTAALKSGREWWPDGTASYLALSLSELTTPFGEWMKQWGELLRYGTFAVYLLEAAVALLILCPFYSTAVRLATIAALGAMHLSFALAMHLGIFPFVAAAALLPLLPGPALDWLALRMRTAELTKVRLYYDGNCGFCKKMAYLIRGLWAPAAQVLPLQEEPALLAAFAADPSWVVVDAAGVQHRKWAGVVQALAVLPLLGPLAAAPLWRGAAPFGDRLYDWVARHRPQLGALTRALLPWRDPVALRTTWAGNAAALGFLAYVAAWNLKTLPNAAFELPGAWGALGPVLRLDQKWNMFAPYPLRDSGWYVLPGELRDGRRVDVLSGDLTAPSLARPALISATYGNARWRKYLMNLYDKTYAGQRVYYGRWLCRRWNADHDGGAQLARFDIIYMKQTSALPGAAGPAEAPPQTLWRHDCGKRATPGSG